MTKYSHTATIQGQGFPPGSGPIRMGNRPLSSYGHNGYDGWYFLGRQGQVTPDASICRRVRISLLRGPQLISVECLRIGPHRNRLFWHLAHASDPCFFCPEIQADTRITRISFWLVSDPQLRFRAQRGCRPGSRPFTLCDFYSESSNRLSNIMRFSCGVSFNRVGANTEHGPQADLR